MVFARVTPILFGLLLALTLALGNPAHALISHEHGSHHHEGESVVWQSLHSALRHEDKKMLPVFDTLAILGSVTLVVLALIRKREYVPVFYSLHDALRRGILPHRKFG